MNTLPERLAHWAAATPGRVAISCAGVDTTYGELWAQVGRATARLASDWNVAAGDRIGYLGLNHGDQLVALAALMRLGALLVPLNYRLAGPELRAIAGHAGISQLIVDEHCTALAAGLDVPLRERAALAGVPVAARPAFGPIECDPQTPALLVYTSGTTGTSKGAVHTHAGLSWNTLASQAMHDFTADDTVLSPLPLFHVGGMCIQTIPALHAGARVIIQPRFDPGAWLDIVAAERPTISLMVPATMRAVQEHPRWPSTDLSSLRLLGAGSSTIPDTLIAGFHARGVPVCQIYGATETGPVSIVLRPEEAFAHAGAAGRPALGCTIRLAGDEGDIAGVDRVGEIWVRGPNVMQGYWRNPDHPAFADGWFRTGDLARRDAAGYYTVVGRLQDMIISGGENIYPAEIENVLAGIPEIAEAAAIGVPDSRWGEVPVAVVVLRPGAALTEAAIRARFEGTLARFKHPRRIVFRATLPKSALGKVQKPALVNELMAGGA
ncbi:MAG: AMP-binding protein [Betaproteobacteria bacterium]|nr:AMP-binding protein [Betaproteobacteria bacterium]